MRSAKVVLMLAAVAIAVPPSEDPVVRAKRDAINAKAGGKWKAAIAPNIPYNNFAALQRLAGSKIDKDAFSANPWVPEGV